MNGCVCRLNGISWVWCIFEASWGLLVAFEKYLQKRMQQMLNLVIVPGWCWLPCNKHDQVHHLCIITWLLWHSLLQASTRASHTPLMSIYASYRLAGERSGTRGTRGDSGAGTSGSTGTRRGAAGVSGSPTQHVWERQAPEHSKSPYSR